MQVSVESTTDLGRRVTVELPKEDMLNQINDRLEKLKDQVRVDGFRPGKVPMDVVRSKYGEQVQQEVMSEAINQSLQQALSQEQLTPTGSPEIDIDESAADSVLRYFASFEIMPEIDLQPVEQITLERPVVEIQESDVDDLIETLQKQRTLWVPVDRPAIVGDRITVNYQGTIDGQGFPGGIAEGLAMVVGEGSMLSGFEEQVVGMVAGASAVIEVTIPDSFPAPECRGKTASFDVKVLHVDESELPPVDEALARSFGVTEGGVPAFRDQIKHNMEIELKQKVFDRMKEGMVNQLLQMHTVLAPDSMVTSELDRMKSIAAEQQIDLEDDEDGLVAQAKRRVTTGLILVEMAKDLSIAPSSELVREKIESLAETYENPGEVVAWYYSSQEQLANVESMVTEELLVEYVLQHGQISDKSVSFSDIMAPK